MKSFIQLIALCLLFLAVKPVQAQKKELDTRINILFGLTQPLLARGFNIEGNFFYKRLAFDYSHGVSLDFSGASVTGANADQQLAIHWPFTTGFGVGYRFNEWFNVRVEPKWHRMEIYYDGDAQTPENQIVGYTTFTLGLGAYINWRPWKNKNNALNGIMVAPSVRYWPRISSTLPDDQHVYFNERTGENETHQAMQAGIANTPFIFNISIGYSFGLKKKQKPKKD